MADVLGVARYTKDGDVNVRILESYIDGRMSLHIVRVIETGQIITLHIKQVKILSINGVPYFPERISIHGHKGRIPNRSEKVDKRNLATKVTGAGREILFKVRQLGNDRTHRPNSR